MSQKKRVSNQNEDSGESAIEALTQQIRQGKIPLDSLIRQMQLLDSRENKVAAKNLCALWLAHASQDRKEYAWFNYAKLLQDIGELKNANVAYKTCIKINPYFPHAYINLGLLNEKEGKVGEALKTWLALTRLKLDKENTKKYKSIAFNNIGRVQEGLRNYKQAEIALTKSLELDSNQPGVIQHLVHIRQKSCKWPVYENAHEVTIDEQIKCTSPLAMLALTPDPGLQLECAQNFVSRTYKFENHKKIKVKNRKNQKIRVGYVSGDFRAHAVGFLLPQFFAEHDRSEIEIFGYDFSIEDNSETRKNIVDCFDVIRRISGISDREAAEQINKDNIDVLVDLHGLSSGARPGIFAFRPATQQGAYMGFIGTTAMPWLDFVIVDRTIFPSELKRYFTEEPVFLGGSFFPIASSAEKTVGVERKNFGFENSDFIMAAFANTYKITPEIFATWLRLLNKIPRAVLWLIDDNDSSTENLLKISYAAGIMGGRIRFMPRTTHGEFLERLRLADVFLDTFPYNCGSTSIDVISSNVPLVTLFGETMVSRMGFSILTAAGEARFATRTIAEYEKKVIELYRDKNDGVFSLNYKSEVKTGITEVIKRIYDRSGV